MYRIELSPGDETVFRSIEELAVAIKRGVVTSRARIYHSAADRWLPIQFHPHYKIAVSMELTNAALVAGPAVKPLSTLSLEQPTEPELPEPMLAIAPEPAKPAPTPKKKTAGSGSSAKRSRRTTKPRRQLRIALVGALLVGGAQWVLSAPLFSRAEMPSLIAAQRQLISAPIEAMRRVSSPNTAAMVPVMPQGESPPAAGQPKRTQPPSASAPSFGGSGGAVESADASEIQPPPGLQTTAPAAPSADSLTGVVVDSTGAKSLRRILQSVSGPPEPKPVKR